MDAHSQLESQPGADPAGTKILAQRLLALVEGPGSADERLDRLREAMRAVLFEAPAAPPLAVSERQMRTLELLAQGLSNRGIARRLDLAEETVKCQVRSLLDRLNVPNRTSLALWAIREGIVPIHARPQPGRPMDARPLRRPDAAPAAMRSAG